MGGVNFLGLSAAYQGYQDEQRRIKDDEQRAKAAQRQDNDAGFQEEARHRQRGEWARADKNQALDEADIAELSARLKTGQSAASQTIVPKPLGIAQALPSEVAPMASKTAQRPANQAMPAAAATHASVPASTPVPTAMSNTASVIPQPAGIPQPRDFNSVLDMQHELLNRRMARGSLSTQDYAQSVAAINKIKSEGIHQALELMADGDYQTGVDAYNAVGRMRGARVVEGKPGVTKLDNGEEVSTHFVTIQNADGSRTVMDVARARYRLVDFEKKLTLLNAAAQNRMQLQQHKDTLGLSYARLDQDARQSAMQLSLARQKLYADSPAGFIAAREKALGHSFTPEQKATMLGIDTMPQAVKMQVSSILKEQDQLAQTINRAMADGSWQPIIKTDKEGKGVPNPLLLKQNALNLQLSSLLNPQASAGNNVFGLNPSTANRTPEKSNTSNTANKQAGNTLLPAVGGIARPHPAIAPMTSVAPATPPSAANNPKDDFVMRRQLVLKRLADIRNDPQLQALLRESHAAIARGQRVASNNALQRYNDLLAQRYPPL